MSNGWYGFDLDGTLAEYDGFKGPAHIGKPIPLMVENVKRLLAEGKEVRIFTARVYGLGGDNEVRHKEAVVARYAIDAFCLANFGRALPVTCVKDYQMIELWDDRAVQVIHNTGERADTREFQNGFKTGELQGYADGYKAGESAGWAKGFSEGR